jgi:hypothetical protein
MPKTIRRFPAAVLLFAAINWHSYVPVAKPLTLWFAFMSASTGSLSVLFQNASVPVTFVGPETKSSHVPLPCKRYCHLASIAVGVVFVPDLI